MDQDMKSARVNPGVAPGSGVYLGLEQGEIEALHVALAAGVAQGLEIAGVSHLVLVRRFLREVLAASTAASRRSQRHSRAKFSSRKNPFLAEDAFLSTPFFLSKAPAIKIWPGKNSRGKILFPCGNFIRQARHDSSLAAADRRCLPAFDSETESTWWRRGFVRFVRDARSKVSRGISRHSPFFSRHSFHGRSPSVTRRSVLIVPIVRVLLGVPIARSSATFDIFPLFFEFRWKVEKRYKINTRMFRGDFVLSKNKIARAFRNFRFINFPLLVW